jgi:hypothetical protein
MRAIHTPDFGHNAYTRIHADGNLQSSGERLPNTGTTTKISLAIIAKRR